MLTRCTKIMLLPLLTVSSLFGQIQDAPKKAVPTPSEITAHAVAGAIAEAKTQSEYHIVSQSPERLPEQLITQTVDYISEERVNSRPETLSPRVYQALIDHAVFDQHEIDYSMSPYFQRGDFNKDGDFEIAILVINRYDGVRSYIVLQNEDFSIVGGGKNFAERRGDTTQRAKGEKSISGLSNLTSLLK